jgi:hypothetical protein
VTLWSELMQLVPPGGIEPATHGLGNTVFSADFLAVRDFSPSVTHEQAAG